MGFPLVCYCFAIPKPVIAFFKLLGAVREVLLLMLSVVGLCRFLHYDRARRRSATGGSVIDAPLPEEVKERLPAVQFARLAAEASTLAPPCHDGDDDDVGAAAAPCIVCLEGLEATDEVRRLGNCAHAFHRGCIDRWIDLGRMTCPLCRSHLLPRSRDGPLASLLTWLGRAVLSFSQRVGHRAQASGSRLRERWCRNAADRFAISTGYIHVGLMNRLVGIN